jgi:hypothetical protein
VNHVKRSGPRLDGPGGEGCGAIFEGLCNLRISTAEMSEAKSTSTSEKQQTEYDRGWKAAMEDMRVLLENELRAREAGKETEEYKRGRKTAAEEFRKNLREAQRKIKEESPVKYLSDAGTYEEHVDDVLSKLLESLE